MKMFVIILAICSTVASAEVLDHADISVGTGFTFGSPYLGVQFATKSEELKLYASVGLVGYAIGFEKPFTDNRKHTLGVTMGQEFITSDVGFGFITYTYHVKSIAENGLLLV